MTLLQQKPGTVVGKLGGDKVLKQIENLLFHGMPWIKHNAEPIRL
jgi:hypothetical protein